MAISAVQTGTTSVLNSVTGATKTSSYNLNDIAALYTALMKGSIPDAPSSGKGNDTSSSLDGSRNFDLSTVSDATLTQLETAMQTIAQLFANPSNSVDAVAAALIELQGRQSAESQQESLNDANTAVQQSLAQADTLRKEGDALIAGAASQLVMTVTSALISGLGAGLQIKGLGAADGNSGLEGIANAKGAIFTAIAKGVDAVGGLGNAIAQQQAKLDEAEGAEDQAAAQQKNSTSQYKQKITDDLKQLVDQITQLVAALMQNKAALAQAIAG